MRKIEPYLGLEGNCIEAGSEKASETFGSIALATSPQFGRHLRNPSSNKLAHAPRFQIESSILVLRVTPQLEEAMRRVRRSILAALLGSLATLAVSLKSQDNADGTVDQARSVSQGYRIWPARDQSEGIGTGTKLNRIWNNLSDCAPKVAIFVHMRLPCLKTPLTFLHCRFTVE